MVVDPTQVFVSPETRLEAWEEKATNRPSALIAGASRLSSLASIPVLLTLTRVVDAGEALDRAAIASSTATAMVIDNRGLSIGESPAYYTDRWPRSLRR